MGHERPPQLRGWATLLRQQPLTPQLLRLHFHAPALARLQLHRAAHALHVWFGPSRNAAGEDDKSWRRVFTLSQFNAASATLAIDVLRHPDGLAGRWAASARPGDRLEMAGPRSGCDWAEGAHWLFAAGDDSALPALACLIERAPPLWPLRLLLQLRHADNQRYLDPILAARQDWQRVLLISDPTSGSTPAVRADTLAPLQLAELSRIAGAGQAFVAGEADWVRQLRDALTRPADALPWQHLQASGYWQLGRAGYGHG